ncbi:MAG: TOBE domain-containing protein [Roseovarius sp.]|nr:TOBE domain-containing protein [Roseovarius sp.]
MAIARALAAEPALLLLDEPLSALDARVRTTMRGEIREMQQALGIPTIMVTHDQEEALTMADRVVCMNQGEIVQVDTPINLYQRPRTRFVADFVGVSNFLPPARVGEVMPDRLDELNGLAAEAHEFAFRPEQVLLHENPDGAGTVTKALFLGNLSRITVSIAGHEVVAEVAGAGTLPVGTRVKIGLDPGSGTWVET